MFLSALINTKLSLVAGMAVALGWPRFARKCAKKRVNSANRNTATQHGTSD